MKLIVTFWMVLVVQVLGESAFLDHPRDLAIVCLEPVKFQAAIEHFNQRTDRARAEDKVSALESSELTAALLQSTPISGALAEVDEMKVSAMAGTQMLPKGTKLFVIRGAIQGGIVNGRPVIWHTKMWAVYVSLNRGILTGKEETEEGNEILVPVRIHYLSIESIEEKAQTKGQ